MDPIKTPLTHAALMLASDADGAREVVDLCTRLELQNAEYSRPNGVGSVSWLCALRDAANRAVDEAKKLHAIDGDASRFLLDTINWGDLSCLSASWYRDSDGVEGPEVLISEASPDGASFLCAYVESRLDQLGFPGVVARTEW